MSSILSCRDARFDCAYSALTSARATVDVSTATLVSLWDSGCQREIPQLVPAHSGLHESVWSNELSPHLQRNEQLQDTLMQKEEELARLQEENNKLKEFLNSSYVKSLEDKTKRLFSDIRNRKRVLHDERDFFSVSRLLGSSEGKRTCRNLSLEFCSAEEVAATPSLDSWVLETLGLQDEDIIRTDSNFSSLTTEHTPSFTSPATSTDYFSPTLQGSSALSTSADDLTLGASRMYTLTSMGSLQDIETRTGQFTPPKAVSTPQRLKIPSTEQYHYSQGFSSPSGDTSVLFSTRSRTDLAFSMSLSPQSSVKTHTFPQGQAFTRRDSQGGWNFTWVPKECY